MLVSIPTKAKDRYIEICHEVFNAPTPVEFQLMCFKAEVYGAAIKDICGVSVWTSIVMEADLSFPEGTETCCGVPFKSKH